MRKIILIFGMLMFNLFSFSSNNNINYHVNYGLDENELCLMVKKRTERDLKKLGIKKVLLYNKGFWIGSSNYTFTFKNNGVLLYNIAERSIIKMLWKVVNKKLYINPKWKNLRKFYLTNIKPTADFPYGVGYGPNRNKYLKQIKYAVFLISNKKVKNQSDGSIDPIFAFILTINK